MGRAVDVLTGKLRPLKGSSRKVYRGAIQRQKGLETLPEAEFPYQADYFCMCLCFLVGCFT